MLLQPISQAQQFMPQQLTASQMLPFQRPTLGQQSYQQAQMISPFPAQGGQQGGGMVSFDSVARLMSSMMNRVMNSFEQLMGRMIGALTGGNIGGTQTTPGLPTLPGLPGLPNLGGQFPSPTPNIGITPAANNPSFGDKFGSILDDIGGLWNRGKEIVSSGSDLLRGTFGGSGGGFLNGALGGIGSLFSGGLGKISSFF